MTERKNVHPVESMKKSPDINCNSIFIYIHVGLLVNKPKLSVLVLSLL